MRLHAMIASAIAGLPTLPIPYFPKVPMIASDLGITNLISGNDPLWETKCNKFLDNSDLLGVITKQGAARMKKRAEISATVLKEFLNGLG
jgi:polysaccharide pyruvyl transferase WcaK-like protein